MSHFYEGIEYTETSRPIAGGGHNRPNLELVQNFAQISDDALRSAVAGPVRSLARCRPP